MDIQDGVWLVGCLQEGFEPVDFPIQTIVTEDPYTVKAYMLAEKRNEIEIIKMGKQTNHKNNTFIVFRPQVPPCFIDIDKYTNDLTPMQISIYDTQFRYPA